MSMMTHEALFLIEDVFRLGNATSPRLDHIRKHDIPIVSNDGKEMVFPDTGGISVFNIIHPRLHGIWWKCPAGTTYPEELTIICERDYGGLRHYLIQPSYQMELRQYLEALREFALSFDKVT